MSDYWSFYSGFVTWDAIKNLANSPFSTSLLGALAGAFAGAMAAQRIAERSKLREELLREMRNTNAAIALAFGVCNSLLALKKQHVNRLKETYDAQKAALHEFFRKRAAGEISKDIPFEFKADMQTLQPQVLPTDTLRSILFERLSIVGRPLNLVVTLTQTVESLAGSLAKRNSLIESYKVELAGDTERLVPLYFGLPFGGGHVNLDYPGTIDAIYSQTDDGIFFGNLLCKDLHQHGKQLSDTFRKKFKTVAPRISEVDFSPAAADGLMPDDKNYPDWVRAFVKKD
jgi:hypothetical protein